MPNIKVKPLEWYMECDQEELEDQGYKEVGPEFVLIGRDGYYCQGDVVWFEYEGRGYLAYPSSTRKRAREYFCYDLTVNDEAILPQREVAAMREVLNTCRDAGVRRAITSRLQLHDDAQVLRETGRRARITRRRILGEF
jgi:hypothetical protein